MTAMGVRSRNRHAWSAWSVLLAGLGLLPNLACDGPGLTGGGPGLFGPARPSGERWTICCLRSRAPDHAEICNQLAELLKRVRGLNARAVRVQSDAAGSALYYGEYAKVPSPSDGSLVFPPELRRDLSFIQRLTLNQSMPFALAVPEPFDKGETGGHPEWHVSNATGTHTLQIAVCYNTPTFDQRKEAAEQYVGVLRNEGYKAYHLHEAVKSYVFVGDFDQSDVVQTPDGRRGYGPRVAEFIARRPNDEFRYMTENGYLRKITGPDGQMVPLASQLVPVPRGGSTVSRGE